MPLRALVAPQQFKGTLSARQASEAIARGLRAAQPDCTLDLAPIADGGAGTVDALGAKFLDAKGQPLPLGPRHLPRLERVDLSGLDPRLKNTPLEVLADVLNPLLGELGTARIYAPQKGADADEVD